MSVRKRLEPWLALLFAIALASSASAAAPRKATGSRAKVEQILAEWARHAAAIETIDAHYVAEKRDRLWPVAHRFEGRVVFKDGTHAWLEEQQVGGIGKGQPATRYVWADAKLHMLTPSNRSCITFPRTQTDHDRLPFQLALPFLYRMSPAQLARYCEVDLQAEDNTSYTLHFVPRDKTEREVIREATLRINKQTFQPIEMTYQYGRVGMADDRRETAVYRLASVRLNEPVEEKDFQCSVQDGWEVVRLPKPFREMKIRDYFDPRIFVPQFEERERESR